MLWFGFSMRVTLKTHWCFQLLLNNLQHFLASCAWQWEGWRGTSCEGTKLGQLTPTDPRNVPYHMASCSVYELGGSWLGNTIQERTGAITLCNSWFVYSDSLIIIIIIIFFLLCPIKLSLSQPMSLNLPTVSPTPLVGRQAVTEGLCSATLPAAGKPQQLDEPT